MRPRIRTSLALLCLSFGFSLSSARILADEAAPIETLPSSGAYQIVRLQLEQGGVTFDSKKRERIDVPLLLGLRDGKAVVAWFVHPALSGGRVVWLDASTLKLSKTELRGGLSGRTNRHWGNKNVHYFSYTMDAVVGDKDARLPANFPVPERPLGPVANPHPAPNSIMGTFSVGFVDDAGERIGFSGKLSGQILTAQQTATDQLAEGHEWPHYYGDGFRLAGPESQVKPIVYPLVDGLLFVRGLDAIYCYDLRARSLQE